MPYSPRVKALAYGDDPICWRSYSGKPISFKREMDVRRRTALESAQRYADAIDKVTARARMLAPVCRISFPNLIPRPPAKGKYTMNIRFDHGIGIVKTRNALRSVIIRDGRQAGLDILRKVTGDSTISTIMLIPEDKWPEILRACEAKLSSSQPTMTPLAIQMLMHFHNVIGPFGPEDMRTSDSYTRFVKYLLFHKLIERPSSREREKHPGWAYRTTERGNVYVNALQQVPLPVRVEQPWTMPT